jgi:hypothetical protein
VEHLNTTEDRASAGYGLEAKHWPGPPFDGAVILLDAIVQVGTLTDADRLQLPSCVDLEAVRCITGYNRLPLRLAAINHDPLETAVPLERIAQKAFGSSQIAALAEPELNRIPLLSMARAAIISSRSRRLRL